MRWNNDTNSTKKYTIKNSLSGMTPGENEAELGQSHKRNNLNFFNELQKLLKGLRVFFHQRDETRRGETVIEISSAYFHLKLSLIAIEFVGRCGCGEWPISVVQPSRARARLCGYLRARAINRVSIAELIITLCKQQYGWILHQLIFQFSSQTSLLIQTISILWYELANARICMR